MFDSERIILRRELSTRQSARAFGYILQRSVGNGNLQKDAVYATDPVLMADRW